MTVQTNPRVKLPDRRVTWTQKVRIDNTGFFLSVGEYDDGRPGEIWIEAHKMGTFARGVLDTLSRMASIALQSGAPIEEIVKALQGMHFPPSGEVIGEYTQVVSCTSVADWVSQELAHVYLKHTEPVQTANDQPSIAIYTEETPEKSAGFISESKWL